MRRRTTRQDHVWRHIVYGGLFPASVARDVLEHRFGTDPETFDRSDDTARCLFAFEFGQNGRPLFNTFALSSLGWALGRTLHPGPDSPDWLVGFGGADEAARIDFEHRHALSSGKADPAVPNESDGSRAGGEASDKVPSGEHDDDPADALRPPERPLDHHDLVAEAMTCIARLGVESLVSRPMTRVLSVLVSARRDAAKNEPVLLDGFFVDDLGRVANSVENGEPGAALASYLTAPEDLDTGSRIDVRVSIEVLFETLAPALFPIGRWPDRHGHPLVASQQFAVNSIARSLDDGAGIAAVNGPPGTGKTTLLRDLIANVVIERARRLAALDTGEDAFDGSSGWRVGSYSRTVWHWKESFHGHEIVVASSNNGAVENVTLEIPGIDAIDPDALDGADHFRELGSHVLGEEREAWGLMAAKLGNRTNRAAFRNRFFFDRDADEEDAEQLPGMLSLLDRYRKEEGTVDWGEAVETFDTVIAKAGHLREERQRLYVRGVRLRTLTVKSDAARAERDAFDADRLRAEVAHDEAALIETHARIAVEDATTSRLEHRRFRPGLIEIVLTLGKGFREWRAKDGRLASAVEALEYALVSATDARSAKADELDDRRHRYRAAREGLDAISAELAGTIAAQSAALTALGIDAPDPGSLAWQDDAARKLSSPWVDETWNAARAQVFVAALALHRAFLRVNATRMRQNLLAVMDVLDGSVPDEASAHAVADAWRALFFVVPVVSTTFASFARLFPQLGPESLGWVPVDEAGQAMPQEAAGAFWRARRAVVVGDPLQLEPIVSISLKAQEALRRYHGVDELWTPGRTSVQRLADRVTRRGTYMDSGEEPVRVGSPLRVHRRCDQPMVDVCNAIAYDGMMVDGTPPRGSVSWPTSGWLDIRSATAAGHWIEAEGEETARLLERLFALGVDPAQVFLISPFRAVADRLRELATRFRGIRAGTVHTTQGKEADVVVLVLGSDPASAGAREWAASTPNLLNVAVSRAKRRLYVIGDLAAWRRCNHFSTCAVRLERHAAREEQRSSDVGSSAPSTLSTSTDAMP